MALKTLTKEIRGFITNSNKVADPTLGSLSASNVTLENVIDTLRVQVGYEDDTNEWLDLADVLPDGNTQFYIKIGNNEWQPVKRSTEIFLFGGVATFDFDYLVGQQQYRVTANISFEYKRIIEFTATKTRYGLIPVGAKLRKSWFGGVVKNNILGRFPIGYDDLSHYEFDMIVDGNVVEDNTYTMLEQTNVVLRVKGSIDAPVFGISECFNDNYQYLSNELTFNIYENYTILEDEIDSIEQENESIANVGDNNLADVLNNIGELKIKLKNGNYVYYSIEDLTNWLFRVSIDDNSFQREQTISSIVGAESIKLKYVRTPSYNGKAQLTIDFYYQVANETKSYSFNVYATINGFTRIVANTSLTRQVPIGTLINQNTFRVYAYDGFNNITPLDLQAVGSTATTGLYTMTAIDTTTSGIKTITFTAVDSVMVEQDTPITTTYDMEVYESTPSSIGISHSKNNYSIGQRFRYGDISLYAIYYIDETHYHEEALSPFDTEISLENNYRFLPSDIGTREITISYEELETSYEIAVLQPQTQTLVVYDKITKIGRDYGEYENGFNVSLTLDQSKDTSKIIVYNYESEELKPNTICYMPDIDTWWIVKTDKASRYASEKASGLWKHEISLSGAFEILVNRDMINHGYNKDRYTLKQMCERLMQMTDFEFNTTFDFEFFDENKVIGYIKAFENYAPSTALKELFNGMNAIPKMSFTYNEFNELNGAIIKPIPKSGIGNTPIDIETFDSEEETKTSDKSSFGTRVVSNIQNCVSSELIRYPASGSIGLSSDEAILKGANAYINLPYNADYVEKIHIFGRYAIGFASNADQDNVEMTYSGCNSTFDIGADIMLDEWEEDITYGSAVREHREQIKKLIRDNGFVEVYNRSSFEVGGANGTFTYNVSFGDDKYRLTVENSEHCVYWQQGSNKIRNFAFINYRDINSTVVDKINVKKKFFIAENLYMILIPVNEYSFDAPASDTLRYLTFAVYYKPQVNLKLKVENERLENDTNLFNQNGKLVDAVAVSKLINSHAEDISANEITRKAVYYNFFDIPSIGSIVDNHGTSYVINNISYDFNENDDNGYFIEATFSLTKAVACKSTLISANNNIRDYDCPQNYNIKREQLYRDYFELDYELANREPTYLQDYEKLFNFGFKQSGSNDNYICLIKIKNNNYQEHIYFKLSSINVEMPKQRISLVDFQDNNIIGYSKSQNYMFVFNLLEAFYSSTTYNVPISYVDSVGELKSIDLLFVNDSLYNESINETYAGENISLYNDPNVLLKKTTYEYASGNNPSAIISEPNYNKDGLEKPMFELISQINGTNDIVVGDNFLKSITCENDEIVIYQFKFQEQRINEMKYGSPSATHYYSTGNLRDIANACDIGFNKSTRKLTIKLYDSRVMNAIYTNEPQIVSSQAYSGGSVLGRNIVVYRTKLRIIEPNSRIIVSTEMLFGINNCKVELNANNELVLYVNNYKLN